LGRFTSPDLPGADQRRTNPQSWGLYVYVRNNPLRRIDPGGRTASAVLPSGDDADPSPDPEDPDGPPGQGWGTAERVCKERHGEFEVTLPKGPPSPALKAQMDALARKRLAEVKVAVETTGREWGFTIYLSRFPREGLQATPIYTDRDAGFVCARPVPGIWLGDGHGHALSDDPSGFYRGVGGGDRQRAVDYKNIVFYFTNVVGRYSEYTGGKLVLFR
jgi:hypothetical protein